MKKSKLLKELMETKEELRALTEDFSAQVDMYEEAESKAERFEKENGRLQEQLQGKDLKLKRCNGVGNDYDHVIRSQEEKIDELQAVIMAQNEVIAENALDPVPITSDIDQFEHNSLLELVYQLSAHKHDIREFTKSMMDRHENMTNFLNVFAYRYPKLKGYIDGLTDLKEHQELNYRGRQKFPKEIKQG